MKKTYFSIHNFMVDELKLKSTSLTVYALIYSFTVVGSDCYGSIEYIAERVGASYSSVLRAIKKLMEMNYILKLSENNDLTNTYRANLSILSQNDSQNDSQIECQNDSTLLSNCNTPTVKMTDNNKDNNKEIINDITTKHHTFIHRDREYPQSYFGREKVVVMTMRQYVNLLRVVGVTPTLHYIRVLEKIILSRPKGSCWNHYGTIIKWARQDGLVDERGEIFLANN